MCETHVLHFYTVLIFVLTSRWYCHVDDDMYVNVPTLIRKLHSYNSSEKRYLGHNLLGPGRMTVGLYFELSIKIKLVIT